MPALVPVLRENLGFVGNLSGVTKASGLTLPRPVAVVELLMATYQSAGQERTLAFPPDGPDAFVPAVARGVWQGLRSFSPALRDALG